MFNDHNIFSNNIHDAANKLRQIQEANVRSPEQSEELAKKEFERKKAEFIKTHGRPPEMEELQGLMQGRHTSSAAFRRNIVQRSTKMLGDIAQQGDAETVRQIGQVLHGMSSVRDPSLKTVHTQNVGEQIPVSAYRKMIEIGKGKYQIPYQMEPDASDGPDLDSKGSTEEVQQDAAIRSFGTDPRARAIREQPPMRSSIGPTAQDIAAARFGVGRTRKF